MRRVVVTGVGAVSPCGVDAKSSWDAITRGESGIGLIQSIDTSELACRIAGECRDFDPERYIEKKRVREMGRVIQVAVAAADQAIEHAGFAPDERLADRTGTFVGVGLCAIEKIEENHRILLEKGPRRVSPYFIPATISNLAPGQVSMRHNLRGPSYTTTSACSSGAHAIGEAFKWIQRGEIDAAVAGGAEAAVTQLTMAGFASMRALSKRNDEPEKASRPFDRGRDGFVLSEGAAILMLEERETAIGRGAPILAELVGYGATADAYHLTQPAPGGEGAGRAMAMALRDAQLSPDAVDYVNAHATSTPAGDIGELMAIRSVFGSHVEGGLWVSSTKSIHGHLLGAAGGLEAMISVLAIRDGIAPPTINLDDPDEGCAGFDLVPHEARDRSIDAALSNSFGFGGTNASLLFTKHR